MLILHYMAVNIEQIDFCEGEFFRVLRWNRNVDEAQILRTEGVFAALRGKGHVWHLHDEVELTLVAEGHGTRFVGDQISRFTAPNLVLLGPNLPHYWQFDGHSSGLCIQLSVPRMSALLPPGERRELGRLSERAAKGIALAGAPMRQATTRFHEVVDCVGVARIGAVLQLIGGISRARKSAITELSTTRFDVSRLAPGYQSIQRAILLILTQFRLRLALEDVLAEAHMSKATFSRRFFAYTGKTFTQFLNEVRIGYVCQRLAETADSISDIAFASGFHNLAHFNRMFRRHRGISPTEYRTQLT
jgi:AraC-like DNA-binding protein/quercetin dioxygenase-like cupin family protein